MEKTDTKKIGLIGLGIIGSSILRNIHDSEFSPIGFDIDQKIIDTLNHEGLNTSSSLKEIIDQSSIIITSLSAIIDLSKIYFFFETRSRSSADRINVLLILGFLVIP